MANRGAVMMIALAGCVGPGVRTSSGASSPRVAAIVRESGRLRLAAGWREAERRVNHALAARGLSREDEVRLLVERATIEREVGWFRRRATTGDSLRSLTRASALVDERMPPATRAAVAEARGWLVYWSGFERKEAFDQALPLFEEARRLREAAGDRVGLASSWFEIGLVHQQSGRLDRSRDAFTRGHAVASAERLPVELAYLERHMGANAEESGDLMAARKHYRRSLKLREVNGHRWGTVFALITVADLEARLGDGAGASALLDRAAALAVRLDLPVGEATAAESRAALARGASRLEEACDHLEAAARAWTRFGDAAAARAARARAAEWSCSGRGPAPPR